MICTIWTMTGGLEAILDHRRDHFVHFWGAKATPLKSTKNIVKTLSLATWASKRGSNMSPKSHFFTRQVIQKPCKTHSFWPEAPLWNVLFLLVFNFCLKNLFICNLCFYISRSSIFRDRGLFFPLFLVCFSSVFFEASFWAIQWTKSSFICKIQHFRGLMCSWCIPKNLVFR